MDQISSVGGVSWTWYFVELGRVALLEPLVGDGDDGHGRAEDHVEEAQPTANLGQPALVLDLGLEALLLEVQQDAREVARLAEDVEVLGRPVDARVAVHGEGAGDEERDAATGQEAQAVPVELVGLGRGEVRGRWGRARERRVAAADRGGFGGGASQHASGTRAEPPRFPGRRSVLVDQAVAVGGVPVFLKEALQRAAASRRLGPAPRHSSRGRRASRVALPREPHSAPARSRARKLLKAGQMSSRRSISTDWKFSASRRRKRSSIELS